MSQAALFWCAVAAAGGSAAAFVYLLVSALTESADAYASRMGAETSRSFEDLFLFIPPRRIAEIGRTGALAAFLLFFIPLFSFTNAASLAAGTLLGILAAAFSFSLPKRLVAILSERRRLKFNEQLVGALGTMANALRAGFSLNQAFESVAETGEKPISQEFTVLLQQLRVGMGFDDALASLDRRVGSDDLTLVCTSIDIARKTGGNLTEIFDRISDTIRGRMRIERRIRTLTAQGRLQGIAVTCMPFALGAILFVMKPAMMIPFATSPGGIATMAVALALIAGGWLIIRKIIRIDV